MRSTLLTLTSFLSLTLLVACTAAPGGPGGEEASSSSSSQQSSVVQEENVVQVTSPAPNALVSSPLVVTGQARGTWYFEASFPVRLLDADGTILAVAPAQAQGEWMTEEFVPLAVTLVFAMPATSTGTLVLEKDNPSGLPENAASVEIPVQF